MMNKLKGIIQNALYQKILIGILFAFVVFSFVIAASYIEINYDATYYLPISSLMNNGIVPFVDFKLGYTPLSFYIMQIPTALWGQSYTAALYILYAIQLLCSFLIYRISFAQTKSFNVSGCISILYLLLSFYCEGRFYILEPFVLIFGLLGIQVLSKENVLRLFCSGVLCACSLWCKQYGLGFIFLVLLLIVSRNGISKKSLKSSIILLLGFLFAISVFIMILVLQGARLTDLVSFSGSSYEKKGYEEFLKAIMHLSACVPLVWLAVLISLTNIKNNLRKPICMVALAGMMGFLLQCFVRFFPHYLLLVIPFVCILLATIVNHIFSQRKKMVYKMLLFFSLLIPLNLCIETDKNILSNKTRETQEATAKEIVKIIPANSTKVFASQEALHITFLNNYTPPLIEQYGMTNGFAEQASDILQMCKNSNYCIIGAHDVENDLLGVYTPDVMSYIKHNFEVDTLHVEGGVATYYVMTRSSKMSSINNR